MDAANPALLHLLAQVVFVTCDDKMLRLSDQQPDSSLHQPYTAVELGRLRICKQLLIAMEVQSQYSTCDRYATSCALHAHLAHAGYATKLHLRGDLQKCTVCWDDCSHIYICCYVDGKAPPQRWSNRVPCSLLIVACAAAGGSLHWQ